MVSPQTDQLLVQLKRVNGQVQGIIDMYEGDRACIEIVRQIIAARSALGRVARDLLTGEANRCSREQRVEDLDEILKELFKYD